MHFKLAEINSNKPICIPDHCQIWFANNDVTFARRANGRISLFLFPDHCPIWFADNDLTFARQAKCRRRRFFLRLTFSPNETVFIPVNRLMTCESPFASGVLIGYYLLNHLMIGWFQMPPAPSGSRRCLGFTLSIPSSFPSRDQLHVISAACLVTSADALMTLSLGRLEVSVLG